MLSNQRVIDGFRARCGTGEDEVVFAALGRKVRNVVRSYSLEHAAEEQQFLAVIEELTAAVAAPPGGPLRAACVQVSVWRELFCSGGRERVLTHAPPYFGD